MKLCMDTCTNVCTVAIIDENKVLSERTYNYKLKHSEILMVEIDEMLKRLEKESKDIDEVYVTNGPGSFTGIRIGVTAANTIADSLKVEVKGYSVLDAIAANLMYANTKICSMIYARNDRYYFSIYDSNNGKLEILRPYDVLTIDEILKEVKEKYNNVIFAGDIDSNHISKINEVGIIANDAFNIPHASVLPFIKLEGTEKCDIEKINQVFVKPLYLEKSQAEKMAAKND